jgi:hypothetical protein
MSAQDSASSQVAPANGKVALSSSAGETNSEPGPHTSQSPHVSGISGNPSESTLSASPGASPDSALLAANPGPEPAALQAATAPPAGSLANVQSQQTQDPAAQNAAPNTVDRPNLPADESAAAPLVTTGPVQVARMVSGMSQAEMHIGLRTQAFGSVEVHTVVHESQLGLTLGSEKGNLRSFLNSEVPGLQTTLGQHDLRMENIRFLENRAGGGTGLSGGPNQQPRSFRQSSASSTTELPPEDGQDSLPEESISGSDPITRLSVLA